MSTPTSLKPIALAGSHPVMPPPTHSPLCKDGTPAHHWVLAATLDGYTHDAECKKCKAVRTFAPYALEEEGGRAASLRTHSSLAGARPAVEASWVRGKVAKPS